MKQFDVTIIAPISSTLNIEDLQLLLKNERMNLPFYSGPKKQSPIKNEINNLHFASLFVIPPPCIKQLPSEKQSREYEPGRDGFLVLEASIDCDKIYRYGIKDFIDEIVEKDDEDGQRTLYRAFKFCKDFPKEQYDKKALKDALFSKNIKSEVFYVANRGLSAKEILAHENIRQQLNNELTRRQIDTPVGRVQPVEKYAKNNSDSPERFQKIVSEISFREQSSESNRPYLVRYGDIIFKVILGLIMTILFVLLAVSSTLLGSHTSVVENYLVLGSIALLIATTITLIVLNKMYSLNIDSKILNTMKRLLTILPFIIGIFTLGYVIFWGESINQIIEYCNCQKLGNFLEILDECDLGFVHFASVAFVMIGFIVLGLIMTKLMLLCIYSSDEEDDLIKRLVYTAWLGLMFIFAVIVFANSETLKNIQDSAVLPGFRLILSNMFNVLSFGGRSALALTQIGVCVVVVLMFLTMTKKTDGVESITANSYFVLGGVLVTAVMILTLGRDALSDLTIFRAQVLVIAFFGLLLYFIKKLCDIRSLERRELEDNSSWNDESSRHYFYGQNLREIINDQELVRDTYASQNHLISVTEIKTGHPRDKNTMLNRYKTRREGRLRSITLRVVLYVINLGHRLLQNKGSLGGLTTIHFARWVVIDKGRRLLFLSNYDGDWGQYLSDFIDGPVRGLSAIWSNTQGFPRTKWLVRYGANDEQRFKAYARNSQLHSDHWYTRYPDLSVQNVQSNERLNNWIAEQKANNTSKDENIKEAEFESASRNI